MHQKEAKLDITPEDCTFLSFLTQNPIFLTNLFSSQCITTTMDIQSPLDTTELSNLLCFLSYIPTLKTLRISMSSIQAIDIPDDSLQQLLFFSIHDCIQLFELQVGKFALTSLCSFSLSNLPQLRTIDFGFNSLSTGQCAFPFSSSHVSVQPSIYKKQKKSLRFDNLPSLESFLLDNGCCMEFLSVSFNNLPKLTDLIIGSDEDGYNCYSFYCCKELKLVAFPDLQTLEFGSFSFGLTTNLVLSDLPSLLNLQFNDSCFNKLKELRIERLNQLSNITIGNNCFCNVKSVLIQSLPLVHSLHVGSDSFRNCQSICLSNLMYLHVLDIGDRTFSKSRTLTCLDLPELEECTFSNRVFAKIEEIRVDNISSNLEIALQALQSIHSLVCSTNIHNNYSYSTLDNCFRIL